MLELVEVRFEGEVAASTTGAHRVLETSHPERSSCEWKGFAAHWSVQVGCEVARNVAWSYPDPTPAFLATTDFFYPGRVDEVTVGGEVVRPRAGEFYGGWILDETVGPFKGDPGTWAS